MFSHRIDDQLELRLYQMHHADEVFRAVDANRAHIAKWLSWIDTTIDIQGTRGFIQHSLDLFARNEGVQCGIWEAGRYVGGVGLNSISSANNYSDIGYWLVADACGRGIMTRACHALIDHAFNDLNLNRIEIRAAAENTASRAVARRLGCREEGVLKSMHKIRDTYHDMIVYGLLASEFER